MENHLVTISNPSTNDFVNNFGYSASVNEDFAAEFKFKTTIRLHVKLYTLASRISGIHRR